jgi:outer membrane protein assembly factor BamD (BamD/ComL family)
LAVYPKVNKNQLLVKRLSYRIFFAVVLFFLSGCSTEKNTVVSRAYNNVTAHYNVYFNGKESLHAGVAKINNSFEDDYSKVLPLFKSSNPTTATAATSDMDNAVMKGSKLIQTHSITKKPKRRKHRSKSYIKFASQEEFNNWVDDAYILMGKAYFYQHNYMSAIENFNYVVRKFEDDPSKYTADIWLIRCYTEMERYVEAYELIQVLQGDEHFPKRLDGELATVTSDYYARQLSYKEGIPFLSIAIKQAGKKEDRLRYTYILAQWYQETGDTEKASKTFRAVTRMNPPYKMAFNAQISAASTFTGTGDADKLKKELRKMLHDKKNLEFRDQIYFAIGNISMKEGNKKQAKEEYTKSASLSSANLYQRALSCLTLAQIYFDELSYKNAQSYYDSAMVVIDEKYPNYQKIADRYHSLTRLTDNIYTVEREDSLQRIAKLDESTRNTLINQWIAQAIEKEAKTKKDEATQLSNQSYFRSNDSRFGLSKQQEGAGWYFYNPTTVAYGKVEFERLWGKRKLEDGWRRADKRNAVEDVTAESEDSVKGNEPVVKKITDTKSRDFYTQNLPVNDSLLTISHTKIKNALFNAGRIFKTEFSDFPRASEALEDLNKRYPDNAFSLASYFELYDLYTKMNNQEKADYYKNLIVTNFPDSKYAKYLLNPNYFIELEAKADSINRMYQKAFLEFKNGQYSKAGQITDQIVTMQPDSALVPKIKFIRMVADGTQTNWGAFANLLTEYINAYPKAEPKPLAEQILKLIQDSTLANYQNLVNIGYLNDKIKNSELLPENAKGTDAFEGKFSYDEDLLHYFVIAYPKDANIDLNRLKFDIANYNIDHYTKVDFDIETQNLNNNTALLLIRSLNDKEQGLIYFRSIIKQRSVFQALKNIKYVNFVASSTNFREITADKNYDEYLKFFVLNYSKFITGDFTDEVLPEPEELMAKAKAEENTLKEKGSFVTITPSTSNADLYTDEETGPQNFVIAVNAPGFNLKPVAASFEAHNRDQYAKENLTIVQKQLDNNQLLIVRPFKTKNEAISYFTKAVATRKLYKSLDTLGYRNFIITDANLKKMNETKRIADYLTFFRAKYIGVETTPANAVKTAPAAYSGPYKQKIDGLQSFLLIVPKEEVNADALAQSIQQYNTQNYPQAALKLTNNMLDDFRIVIKVEGFTSRQMALDYLRAISKDQGVYGPIQNANYRNFIITPENETIFRQGKNILTYMEFYKQFYLAK